MQSEAEIATLMKNEKKFSFLFDFDANEIFSSLFHKFSIEMSIFLHFLHKIEIMAFFQRDFDKRNLIK
jgi:hypothetical protein